MNDEGEKWVPPAIWGALVIVPPILVIFLLGGELALAGAAAIVLILAIAGVLYFRR
jgi:hypothetical protein